MRYTERISENDYNTSDVIIEELKIDEKNEDKDYIIEQQKNIIAKLENKLGKLEDLEEEIGCPLEVVIKAIKQGKVWNGYTYLLNMKLTFFNDTWILSNGVYSVCLKDYKGNPRKFDAWWLKEDRSE